MKNILSIHKLYLDILHHVTHILDTLQDVIEQRVTELTLHLLFWDTSIPIRLNAIFTLSGIQTEHDLSRIPDSVCSDSSPDWANLRYHFIAKMVRHRPPHAKKKHSFWTVKHAGSAFKHENTVGLTKPKIFVLWKTNGSQKKWKTSVLYRNPKVKTVVWINLSNSKTMNEEDASSLGDISDLADAYFEDSSQE